MPAVNYPPANAPAWIGLGCSDLRHLILVLRDEMGWTQAAPTATENNAIFKNARCDEGHAVVGRMFVSPEGVRYAFAVCNNAAHRQLLVPWGPDYCMGGKSGMEP